jgi:hypothetical protein
MAIGSSATIPVDSLSRGDTVRPSSMRVFFVGGPSRIVVSHGRKRMICTQLFYLTTHQTPTTVELATTGLGPARFFNSSTECERSIGSVEKYPLSTRVTLLDTVPRPIVIGIPSRAVPATGVLTGKLVALTSRTEVGEAQITLERTEKSSFRKAVAWTLGFAVPGFITALLAYLGQIGFKSWEAKRAVVDQFSKYQIQNWSTLHRFFGIHIAALLEHSNDLTFVTDVHSELENLGVINQLPPKIRNILLNGLNSGSKKKVMEALRRAFPYWKNHLPKVR